MRRRCASVRTTGGACCHCPNFAGGGGGGRIVLSGRPCLSAGPATYPRRLRGGVGTYVSSSGPFSGFALALGGQSGGSTARPGMWLCAASIIECVATMVWCHRFRRVGCCGCVPSRLRWSVLCDLLCTCWRRPGNSHSARRLCCSQPGLYKAVVDNTPCMPCTNKPENAQYTAASVGCAMRAVAAAQSGPCRLLTRQVAPTCAALGFSACTAKRRCRCWAESHGFPWRALTHACEIQLFVASFGGPVAFGLLCGAVVMYGRRGACCCAAR